MKTHFRNLLIPHGVYSPPSDAIRKELEAAGITVVAADFRAIQQTEITFPGWMGVLVLNGETAFTFRRQFAYWAIDGFVPLKVARALYELEIDDHLPNPDQCAKHYDKNGVQLVPNSELEGYTKDFLIGLIRYTALYPGTPLHYVDDPAGEAVRSGVESHHITTQEGLNLFVKTVRQHRLVDRASRRSSKRAS